MGALKTSFNLKIAAMFGSMAEPLSRKNGAGYAAAIPALFLCLAAAPGGMRSAASWGVFSAVFLIYLAFFEKDFSLSGLGPWALLGAWLLAGTAFSAEPLNSFWYFSRYLILLAFLSFTRKAGEAARTPWIGAVFLLAGAACLTVFWQALTGRGVSGMIGPNVNYSTAFMAAAFAGLAALLFQAEKSGARIACALGLALLGAAIAVVNSRGAVLGALAAVFFMFCLKGSFRAAVYFVIAALVIVVCLPAGEFNWLLKLYDPRSLGRFGIWGSAFDAMAARPVFGWGPGLFERAFEMFKFPFHDGISYYGHFTLHAHSEPLNLAAEAGIPAMLVFVWAWARGTFRAPGKDTGSLILKVFAVSLFAQSSVDIIFYSGTPQILFFGTMGLLAAGERHPVEAPRVTRPWLLIALSLCCGAAFLSRFSFERARVCALDPSVSPALRSGCLKKALAFAPGDAGLAGAAVPLSLALDGNYVRAAALAENAILRTPKSPLPYFDAANLYLAGGDSASAERLLRKAAALEPDFLRARLALAEISLSLGERGAAAREIAGIEAVLNRKPDLSRASAYDRALLSLPGAEYDKIRKKLR
ncbi:MAG TPA: hypothetical protein DEF68_01800 [Elusimicrobia bacterium]|nr:hypothetical protein [Elusimicrobiota bacterium]HBW22096.1 hypothetical protein [Elusimicrobiota bacterium]